MENGFKGLPETIGDFLQLVREHDPKVAAAIQQLGLDRIEGLAGKGARDDYLRTLDKWLSDKEKEGYDTTTSASGPAGGTSKTDIASSNQTFTSYSDRPVDIVASVYSRPSSSRSGGNSSAELDSIGMPEVRKELSDSLRGSFIRSLLCFGHGRKLSKED